jgi:ArsR family transcriptional regulator
MPMIEAGELVEPLGALADPTRLEIVGRLRRQDHCVCHLVDELGLKQSLVSHHIGVLRRAGLVTSYPHRADRRWLYYRLNREAFRTLNFSLSLLADDAEYDPTPLPCPIDFTQAEHR